MKVGIVGAAGVVGNAHCFGFSKLGHKIFTCDPKLGTTIKDVLEAEIVYICVPTPMKPDKSCDTSIVEEVVWNLKNSNYEGIIVIKSTVKPGTTVRLSQDTGYNICFSCEMLRERAAITDFVQLHNLLAVGTNCDDHFKTIVACHGNYPKYVMKMQPTEVELLKYVHNTFNGLRVVFANEIYDICKALNIEYRNVKEALLKTCNLPDMYLDVNEGNESNNSNDLVLRGYKGTCLSKDIPALCSLVRELNLHHLKLFDAIVEENDKYKKTVFPGMRYGD